MLILIWNKRQINHKGAPISQFAHGRKIPSYATIEDATNWTPIKTSASFLQKKLPGDFIKVASPDLIVLAIYMETDKNDLRVFNCRLIHVRVLVTKRRSSA